MVKGFMVFREGKKKILARASVNYYFTHWHTYNFWR